MFTYTKHALLKKRVLKELGWDINKKLIEKTVSKPIRVDEDLGQIEKVFIANQLVNKKHVLRIVYKKVKNSVVIITFYVARRERYEI
ncbi:MAG: hypothetical protein UT08_C0018G0053 [Candidatus Woesebacteria bacterium GW2011_GWB1_38_8]|uniref:DUF4258 domain-containing protein n=2 Tax=Candidatus Woeseibacteriota TaxID=1752722 RepID=A0A0G0L0B4_9BACT|nr:MAG: hypothetical protein UT08_C0018G0053 [Candidatus Woesebacteria bacterium GW2011_GWB1_38_8]OGM21295.1 MAG: hypothetical protein A2863_03720 [Candidatus Woesebacteria bacterium RIFCSPHIGHO2_01_FULL_38_9b]